VPHCEDYPACGCDPGDCPDPDRDTELFWPLDCVECRGAIKRGDEGSSESMHDSCEQRYLNNSWRDGFDVDPGPDQYDD
jgi:hypothetical protein